MNVVLVLLCIGCVENVIFGLRDYNKELDTLEDTAIVDSSDPEDNPQPDDNPQPEDNPQPGDSPTSEPDSNPDDNPQPDDPVEQPGDSLANPRTPLMGEVVINELMIDPDAVADRDGEWIELWNVTDDWIDLTGYSLLDLGVDDAPIQVLNGNSLVIPPNDYLLICANGEYWDNGGITCQGSFVWQSFGGGFSLANGEDEVILVSPSNLVIDSVFYQSGFSVVGASMGVSPSDANYVDNDDLNNWCDQWSFLPQGDAGSPSSMNDICF